MKFFSKYSKKNKGQSFVELSLVLTALLIIVLGVVELGLLLNYYLELQDTVREVARYASNGDPWHDPNYYSNVLAQYSTMKSRSNIDLDPADGGGITLSFYMVDGAIDGDFVKKLNGVVIVDPAPKPAGGDEIDSYYLVGHQNSFFTVAEIEDQTIDISATTPFSGMIVVEGYYRYHPLLNPIITQYIGETINVHTFSIMPMSAAEPNK